MEDSIRIQFIKRKGTSLRTLVPDGELWYDIVIKRTSESGWRQFFKREKGARINFLRVSWEGECT